MAVRRCGELVLTLLPPRRARSARLVANCLASVGGLAVLIACAAGPPRPALEGQRAAYQLAEVGARRGEQEPTCVGFWTEVRYRNYGYDHVIHLDNRCELTAFCRVSSDVNPKPADVTVPPTAHVEVLSFRGSPARQFTPRVACRLRG